MRNGALNNVCRIQLGILIAKLAFAAIIQTHRLLIEVALRSDIAYVILILGGYDMHSYSLE